MTHFIQLLGNATPRDPWEVIGILAPFLIAGMAIYFGYLQAKKAISGGKHLEERKEIYQRLNQFYGPLLQYLQKSDKLYQRFKIRLKKDDEQFRPITYFIANGNDSLTDTERDIFDEIIRIGTEIEKLVFTKCGLVSDETLTKELLSDYTTHLYFLQLAYSGKLHNENAGDYLEYAFPGSLAQAATEAKTREEDRLKDLNNRI